MTVKKYLINRIMELESDLNSLRNEYAATKYSLKKKQEELTEKLEQYQIEREHIKEIITCNISRDVNSTKIYCLELLSFEDDFKTLMSILDIKPEDYKEVIPDAETED